MPRAVVYTRVSTSGQALEGVSLEAQEVQARERCEREGWDLIGIYTDVMSGRKDARPELARLMRDAEAGAFQVVIVYRTDRLARSTAKTLQVVGELADAGVRFVSLTQQLDLDGATGKMMLAMMASFAEMESTTIGQRVNDARKHLMATKGKHYAVPPFGYQRPKGSGTLEPCPEEADRVRWIFEQVATRRPYRAICAELNDQGVSTRSGKPWTMASLKVVLRNRVHLGELTHGRKALRRDSRGRVIRFLREDGEFLSVPGAHEAIVTPELWARANNVLNETRGMAPRTAGARQDRPWVGLVRCGYCGGSAGRRVKKTPLFECGASTSGGPAACPGRRISVSVLEALIVPVMADALAPTVEEGTARVKEERKRKPASRAAEAKRLEAAIAKEGDLYRLGVVTLEQLTARVADLRAKLAALSAESAQPVRLPPRFDDLIGLWLSLEEPDRAGLLRGLVESVSYTADQIKLIWRSEWAQGLGEGVTILRPFARGQRLNLERLARERASRA